MKNSNVTYIPSRGFRLADDFRLRLAELKADMVLRVASTRFPNVRIFRTGVVEHFLAGSTLEHEYAELELAASRSTGDQPKGGPRRGQPHLTAFLKKVWSVVSRTFRWTWSGR